MNGYIFTIIVVSVISGIISSLLSSNKNSLKKYVNFISGLICSLALLSPIVSIAVNMDKFSSSVENLVNSLSISESANITNKLLIETGTEQISEGIKKTAISRFNFSEENIEVKALVNDDNIEAVILESIEIYLKNEATWTDEQLIKKYVEDLVGCQVKIIKR